jgi:peptidyl-prolyl cis-trans isomerase C
MAMKALIGSVGRPHSFFLASGFAAAIFAAWSCAVVAQQAPGGDKATGAKAASTDRTVVARLNNKPIYKFEIDEIVADWSRSQSIDSTNLAMVQASALDRIIGQRLLFEFLREKELVATREEIETNVKKMREELKSQNTTLEKRLQDLGANLASLRTQLATQLSIQKFVAEYGKPELIESYFDRNKRKFDGTELRVSHVLLRPTKNGGAAESATMLSEARRIKEEIESGKLTFADAAMKFSAGPSKSEGGDLGFIGRAGPMVEAFNRAAFELEEGKISDPVITTFGVHLITVSEVKPGDKKLEEVREEVMPVFAQWLIEKLIERERKGAKIEFVQGFPHFKPGTRELAAGK